MKTFNFYLADEDATTGWSNHTFTLQFVAQGAVFDAPRSVIGTVTVTAGLRITIGD